MTCINACEFLTTMDFADFVDEKFEYIDVAIKNKIQQILNLAESVEDPLQYDLYSILDNDDGNL